MGVYNAGGAATAASLAIAFFSGPSVMNFSSTSAIESSRNGQAHVEILPLELLT